MAMTAAELEIVVGADTSEAEDGLKRVDGSVKNSTSNYTSAGLTFTGISAAIGAGFWSLVNPAMEFEDAVADAYIMLGHYEGGIEQLTLDIMSLAEAMPFSTMEVTALVEELAKMGVASEDIMEVATAVMALAMGIGEDLVPTAEVLIGIMKSMDTDMANIKDVADQLFRVLNAGVLDLNSLKDAWQYLGEVMSLSGMSFLEMAGLLTILVDRTIPAERAGRALKKLFNELINPSEKLISTLQDLGIVFTDDVSGAMLSARDIFFNIWEEWPKLTEDGKRKLLEALNLGEFEGVIRQIFDAGIEAYNKFQSAVENSMSLWDAVKIKMGTAKAGFEEFMETIENVRIIWGQKLLPAFKAFLSFMTPLVNSLKTVPAPVIYITSAFVGLIAVVAGILGPLALFIAAFKQVADAVGVIKRMSGFAKILTGIGKAAKLAGAGFRVLSAAIISNPIVLVILAIVAAFALLYKFNVFGFADKVNSAFSRIKQVLSSLLPYISNLLNWFKELGSTAAGALTSGFNTLRSAVTTLWNAFSDIVDGGVAAAFEVIKTTVDNVIQPFRDLKDAITAAFDGDWSTAFDKLKDAASNTIIAVVDLFTALPRTILEFIAGVDWSTVWDGIKTAATASWDAIKSTVTDAISAIVSFFTDTDWNGIWESVKSAASSAWNAVVGFATGVWDSIVAFFSGLSFADIWDGLKTAAEGVWNTLTDVAGAAWSGIVTLFKTNAWGAIWDGLKAAAVIAWDALKGVAETAWGKVKDFFSSINWGSIWNSMKMAARIAWSELKDFASNAWDKVKGFFDGITWSSLWDGMQSAAESAWNAVIDHVESAVNVAIDAINWLIDQANRVPGVDIDKLDRLGENKSAVDALTDSLTKLGTAGVSQGIRSLIAPDAKRTEYNKYEHDDRWDASTGMMKEGESFNLEANVSGAGYGAIFKDIATNADLAGAALNNYNARQVTVGTQSVVSFGQVKTSADTSIAPLASLVGSAGTSMATSWSNNMNRMAFANNGSWTDVNVTATTQSGSAKNSVISNVGAMASNVSARMIAIAGSTRTNMSAASATTLGQMSAMQTGAALRLASMASTASTKMSAIASTTKSQMSAANTSVSTQMAAMSLGTATKMAAMALTTNSNMSNMVSSTKTQTASMTAAMMGGMANTALQVTLGASRWSGIVSSAGSSAASTARSVGYNIGAGVASGLYAALGSVTAAANAIIGQVDRAMRAKAQIHSPSRMTAYLGQMMGEGLAVGMTDMLGDVSKAGLMLSDAASIKPEATLSVGMPVSSNQAYARNEAPTSSTTVHVTNHYTVTVDDLDDVKNATDFVKNLKKEFSLAV